jgi:thioredoxin 1
MSNKSFHRHSNAEEFKDVYFLKFDVDDIPDLTQELGIRAMPTFFVFKDGEKAGDLVGANPTALLELIKKHSA